MAYRKDPRENLIDLDKHAVWEQDNRVEARYVWNAEVLDLCDMTPEEYMKNPIIEAIKECTPGGSGSTSDIIDAIKEVGDKITDNDDENTGTVVETISSSTKSIIDALSGGSVHNEIVYYQASINCNTDVSTLTISDFNRELTIVGSDTYFYSKLGDPTEEDWAKYQNHEITETELRQRSANDYYLMLPNTYAVTRKFVIKEEGINDVTEAYIPTSVTLLEGYTLLRYRDIDHFNIDYPSEKEVHVKYQIRLVN